MATETQKRNFKRTLTLVASAADALILLTALGLHVWALRYLAVSVEHAHGLDNVPHVPFARLFTRTALQTVTGYAVTSVRPPTTSTLLAGVSTLTQVFSFTDLTSTALYTVTQSSPITNNLPAASIAYWPTTTVTRLHSTTGMEGVRSYELAEYPSLSFSTSSFVYTPTPTPTLPPSTPSVPPTTSNTIYPADLLSIDTTTTDSFTMFQTVGLNHGFGKHFVEADVQLDYGSGGDAYLTRGYTTGSVARLGALLALVSIAIVATLARLLACVVKWPPTHRTYIDVAATFLLATTLLAFWSVYGAWTRQTDATRDAFRWFHSQPLYNYLRIDALYDAHPWPAVAVAYVVLWTASVLSSTAVAFSSVAKWTRVTAATTTRIDKDEADEGVT